MLKIPKGHRHTFSYINKQQGVYHAGENKE